MDDIKAVFAPFETPADELKVPDTVAWRRVVVDAIWRFSMAREKGESAMHLIHEIFYTHNTFMS
jgi:hypothetical protein